MKKVLLVLLSLALVLPLGISAFAAETATAPKVYYDQNFDNVTDVSSLGFAWDQNNENKGVYSVEGGKLIVDNTAAGAKEAFLVLWTAPAGTELKDYKLSYDYTILVGTDRNYAALVSYYKDPTHYMGCWIRAQGEYNFEHRVGGDYTGIGATGNGGNVEKFGLDKGVNVTYHVEVSVVNGMASLKINGYDAASATKTITLEQTGKIAIYTKANFKSSYDNIKIEEIPAQQAPDSYRPDQGDTLPKAALVKSDTIVVDGTRGATEGWTELPTLTTVGLDAFNTKYGLNASSLKTWLATDGLYLYVYMETDTAKVQLLEMLIDFENSFDDERDTKLTAAEYDRLLDTEDNGGNKSLWLQVDEKGSDNKSWGYYEPRAVKKGCQNKYGWTYLNKDNSAWACTGDDAAGKHTMEFKLPLGAIAASELQKGDYTIGYESVALDESWQDAIVTTELKDANYGFAALRQVILPCARGNITLPAIASIPADLFRAPKVGAQLSPFCNIAENATFSVVGDLVAWKDADGKTVTKAEAGKTYTVTATLLSKDPTTVFDKDRTTIPANYTYEISADGSTITISQTWTMEAESTTNAPAGTEAPTEAATGAESGAVAQPSGGCSSSVGVIAPVLVVTLLGSAVVATRKKHED